jgi:hypothetical protein
MAADRNQFACQTSGMSIACSLWLKAYVAKLCEIQETKLLCECLFTEQVLPGKKNYEKFS